MDYFLIFKILGGLSVAITAAWTASSIIFAKRTDGSTQTSPLENAILNVNNENIVVLPLNKDDDIRNISHDGVVYKDEIDISNATELTNQTTTDTSTSIDTNNTDATNTTINNTGSIS
jgi:hypothetical protein